MGEFEKTTIAPGVTREDNIWGYILTGAKEALLRSALAKEEWFWNGRRASDGRRLTTVHFKVDGNRARCKPNHWRDGEYIIEVDYPKAEVEKRRAALPPKDGPRELAKLRLDTGLMTLISAFNLTNDLNHGYGFAADIQSRAMVLIKDLYALFQGGEIKPGVAAARESDLCFQRFMQRATSNASE